MIISSKFKDYYDQVIWTYGPDPKIRYERLNLKEDLVVQVQWASIGAPFSYFGYNRELRNYCKKVLIVGERVYSIFKKIVTTYEPYDSQWFLPDKDHDIIKKVPEYVREYKKRGDKIYYVESDHAIELCKVVGQPVFIISGASYTSGNAKKADIKDEPVFGIMKDKRFITISKEIPQLCKIKNFAKQYPANQIYQDLSYVIGNLMHTPPDDNPPVQVDAKIRFQKKGFDPITSFRGKHQK